jgi:hypothetical protein
VAFSILFVADPSDATFFVFLIPESEIMRKFFIFIPLLVILLGMLPVTSCQKKTDPVPDFPQLMGAWSGTTSQGTSITFWVSNLGGNLNTTSYDLWAYVLPEGLHEYRMMNANGIAYISNRQFKISLGTGSGGEAFIDGTFNVNDMSLYGTFAVYSPSNTIDRVTGTYSAMQKTGNTF